MFISLKNDYGTLECRFNGLNVWFCDNPSNELFERLEKRLISLYGEGTKLDRVVIDTDKVDVKIFIVGQEEFAPFLTVSFPFFFRACPDCDLLKFVNMFSRKTLRFVNGRAFLVTNPKVRNMFKSSVS